MDITPAADLQPGQSVRVTGRGHLSRCGIVAFLDEAQKRKELERLDQASAEFERATASRQSLLQKLVALIATAAIAR